MDSALTQAIYSIVAGILEDHIHSPQGITPLGATPAALVAGVGAYTWGAFVELMPAGTTTALFDLHWAIINNPDTNGDYEIEFVYGQTDTHACYAGFRRSAPTVEVVPMPLMTIRIPAGSRIQARCRHSIGAGAPSVAVSRVYYHEY
jgi:hypothetical protein